MPLPTMTDEQRAAGLEAALAARKAVTAALARVTDGTLPIADALAKDGPLKRAKVRRVLTAVPGIGPVSAGELLGIISAPDDRRVAGLGSSQRADLITLLEARTTEGK